MPVTLEQIVSLAKRRGFVFPGSEIYGGLAGTFDYGPLGVALKNNLKALWWKRFVEERDDMYGVDAAILMNPKAWEASGHIGGFSDPLVKCKECSEKFRADHLVFSQNDLATVAKEWTRRVELIEKEIQKMPSVTLAEVKAQYEPIKKEIYADPTTSLEQKIAFLDIYIKALNKFIKTKNEQIEALDKSVVLLDQIILSKKYIGLVLQDYLNRFVSCPNCCADQAWDVPTAFNMMFKTAIGAADDESAVVYLRPETAGGMFVNFKSILDSMHPKLPFGMAQIGKAFRNEIAPRDFVFRVREFEQMEIEYFVHENDWKETFETWLKDLRSFADDIGLPADQLHMLEVTADDLAHYSKRTVDFEFDYPFGRKELWGLAYRTNFDLSAHQDHSSQKLEYFDEDLKESFVPHVIEPSLGVDRTVLAVLSSAYREDELGDEKRLYLALVPKIAPIKAMVSPLLKNKPELVEKAKEVRTFLKKIHPAIAWDDNGNIGKRYRRQDEIGTPFCITIDFDTLGETPDLKDTVTLRHRDSGEQERLSIEDVAERIKTALA